MALIHVIIPVYNAISYLREAVLSVLNQPTKEIDIILVDDGSEDGSSELCDDLADKENCITVIHQTNKGVSAARNAGIEHCLKNCPTNPQNEHNEYIAFLDADDMWCSNVLDEKTINDISNNNSIDVFLFGSVSCTEKSDKYSKPITFSESILPGGNQVIWKTPGHFCANLYSLRLFSIYGVRFINNLKYSEDKILRMQCVFLASHIKYMVPVLHIYRNNSKSAMKIANYIEPIKYYLPIIEGWIASDIFSNNLYQKTGKQIKAGNVLAGIYFGDMLREHFMLWKSSHEIGFVKNHSNYDLYVNMESKDVSVRQYRNHCLFLKHPKLFQYKYNLYGVLVFMIRSISKIKLIRVLRMSIQYPINRDEIMK